MGSVKKTANCCQLFNSGHTPDITDPAFGNIMNNATEFLLMFSEFIRKLIFNKI